MEFDMKKFTMDIEDKLLKELNAYGGSKTDKKKQIKSFIEEEALIYTTISEKEMLEIVFNKVKGNEQLRLKRMIENELYEKWNAYNAYPKTQIKMINTFVKEYESEFVTINKQDMKDIVIDYLKECKKEEEKLELSRLITKKGLYAEWKKCNSNETMQEELIEVFIEENRQGYEVLTEEEMKQCILERLQKEKMTEDIYIKLGINNDEER